MLVGGLQAGSFAVQPEAVVEAVVPPPGVEAVRSTVSSLGIEGAEIQRIDDRDRPGLYLIRMAAKEGGTDPTPGLRDALVSATKSAVEILRVENVEASQAFYERFGFRQLETSGPRDDGSRASAIGTSLIIIALKSLGGFLGFAAHTQFPIAQTATIAGFTALGSLIGERVGDRKSTRLNSSHMSESRMPSSA